MLFLFLCSCSQLARDEYISIDSYPRGVKVTKHRKDKEVPLGETPVFDQEKKSADTYYSFEYQNEAGKTKTISDLRGKQVCGLEWTDPLVKKIPILGKLLPDFVTELAPKYNPLNLIKGAHLECASLIRKELKDLELPPANNSCRRLIVIPPPHQHQKVSSEITAVWKEQVFKKNKDDCDKVISEEVSGDLLTFMGFHHLSRYYGMKYMLFDSLAKMSMRLKGTEVVFLNVREKNGKYEISPEVYDVHSKLRTVKKLEAKVFMAVEEKKNSYLFNRFGRVFQFIPNSFSLKFRMKQNVHLESSAAEERHSTKMTHLSLPPSFRMSTIQQPIGSWGTNFRFSPSLSYRHWEREYDIRFLSAVMAIKLFAHAPFGSFIGRIGLGGAQVHVRNNDRGFNKNKFVNVTQWGAEYYRFITDRFFFTFGYRKNKFKKDVFVDGDYHFRSYSSLFINLGWYTPELNLKVKEMLYF